MMDAPHILIRNIDKTQLPPLHQKRILAFVNHFLITSCTFLNEFATQCETKFIELERKLQQVEAALVILETKLEPIPNTLNGDKEISLKDNADRQESSLKNIEKESISSKTEQVMNETEKNNSTITSELPTIEQEKYSKFFKMLRIGVPVEAIKMKMSSEGLDPNVLDCSADSIVFSKTEI